MFVLSTFHWCLHNVQHAWTVNVTLMENASRGVSLDFSGTGVLRHVHLDVYINHVTLREPEGPLLAQMDVLLDTVAPSVQDHVLLVA